MFHVEQRFPHAFFAPGRWETADGYMPFGLVWAYFGAMRAGLALDALTMARAIGIALADTKGGEHPADVAIAEAFPRERER